MDLSKLDLQHPPENYEDTKLVVGTFTALQYALVGKESAFYLEVLRCRRTFDNDYVKMARSNFSPAQARQVVWGIHEGMVEFYGTQMPSSDLLQPTEAEWTTVSLARVVDAIRHGSHLELRFSRTSE